MHIKDFQGWNKLKQKLSSKQDTSVPTIKEREIWWLSIGINVGDEEDGHNELYNRPVLIVRKFSTRLFWGVPLTTKIKDNRLYFPIDFKGQKQCIMLTHLRLYDAKRLQDHHSRMGTLPDEQFNAVKAALKKLL
jgi:mRNA-degrading endonuclease toxin of MazEF toxin-antitoxin module